jgi:hypothetical protein
MPFYYSIYTSHSQFILKPKIKSLFHATHSLCLSLSRLSVSLSLSHVDAAHTATSVSLPLSVSLGLLCLSVSLTPLPLCLLAAICVCQPLSVSLCLSHADVAASVSSILGFHFSGILFPGFSFLDFFNFLNFCLDLHMI